MKILLLIACVLFSALSFGENPEAPTGNGDEGAQGEQLAITNYPEVLRFYARLHLRNIKYVDDTLIYSIYGSKLYTRSSMDHIKASAERDCENGVISEESLRLIGIICDQIKVSDIECGKHRNKYKFLEQMDFSTESKIRQLKAKFREAQNEWNAYATSTRAQVDQNIRELKHLLAEKN
jgi:hypothetical protein